MYANLDDVKTGRLCCGAMPISRWAVTYTLTILIVPALLYDVDWVVRYWPTITSTFWEFYQCAGLR